MTETMHGNPLDTDELDPSGFPEKGPIADAIRFCLRYAILAPSSHNAQPWWFRVADDTVTIGLDVSRGLAVSDPLDREGLISVGAALLNLRVALAHFGLRCKVQTFPDPHDPEACATVVVSFDATPDELADLFDAIPLRHTSHSAFDPSPVDPNLLVALQGEAATEEVGLHVAIAEADRERIATLVSDGDRHQMADHSFRRELASWLRRPLSPSSDGIHGHLTGSPIEDLTLVEPLVVRTFDLGDLRGARDKDLALGSPAMLVLSTHGDSREDWLRCGQALQRVLLRATLSGLAVGFLDQAVEVPDIRAALADELADQTVPQIVLRVGQGTVTEAQPRRDLATFLSP